MKHLRFAVFVLLPSCFCWPCDEPREPTVWHEEYLPFKQPNRDSSRPAMVTLRDEGDGTYWEMPHSLARGFGGKDFAWGKRYTAEVTSRYNTFTKFPDRRLTALLDESEDVADGFRLHSISTPYFGEDARSFIDGKAFECADDDVCARLDAALQETTRFDMIMNFGPSSADPLVLKAVESATCYSTNDCTVLQECCIKEGEQICVTDGECPEKHRVGQSQGPDTTPTEK